MDEHAQLAKTNPTQQDNIELELRGLFANIRAEPRVYQQRICETAVKMFSGSHQTRAGVFDSPARSVMIESPTGSGKTVMALVIARWMEQVKKLRVGWVSMRRHLLAQAEHENKHWGFNLSLKYISMFDKNPPEVDALIVDEAQHDAAATMAGLHGTLKPKMVLGLTATPFRTDRVKLCFDKVITDAGIHQLIQEGYLSQYRHYTIPAYAPEDVAMCYAREPSRWGKSLIFFQTYDDCVKCCDLLVKHNVPAEIVTAKTDRERQLGDFEDNKLTVLLNMLLLTEGFDCPSLRTVFCRPSGRGPTVQMAGRVFRKCESEPLKQVVQCRQTRYPITRTANAKEQYVWTHGQWRSLTVNPAISAISRRALAACATANVQLPTLLNPKLRLTSVAGLGSRPRDE